MPARAVSGDDDPAPALSDAEIPVVKASREREAFYYKE